MMKNKLKTHLGLNKENNVGSKIERMQVSSWLARISKQAIFKDCITNATTSTYFRRNQCSGFDVTSNTNKARSTLYPFHQPNW